MRLKALAAACGAGVLLVSLFAAGATAVYPNAVSRGATVAYPNAAVRGSAPAPGGPGLPGTWDTGRTMGVGASLSTRSRLLFTIDDGILGEVYFPTVDTPDVATMQYVIVDGHGIVTREGVDTQHAIRQLDDHAPAFEVTNTARDGSYRIVTDYCVDSQRDVLLLYSRFQALRPAAQRDTAYVLLRPNVNGTSLNNTATVSTQDGGMAITVANLQGAYGPVALALLGQPALGAASVGYHLSTSDPWLDLQRTHRLSHIFTVAASGTITALADVGLRPGHAVTLAMAFGPHSYDAVDAARHALAVPFAHQLALYEAGWHAYTATLHAPAGLGGDLLRQFYLSAMVLKASEDKTYRGAIVASPTIPWGNAQTAGSTRVGGYHLVWARDLYEIASSLLVAGDRATAREALQYLFTRQQGSDGSMPQNTWLNGDVNGGELQLDEVAYPVILAWQLGMTDRATYAQHIAPAAAYLIQNGPATPFERWEEAPGYSPSTIAAEIAALICAGDVAQRLGQTTDALIDLATADYWSRSVAGWTVTRSGHLSSHPYYIRIDDNTDPNDGDMLGVANGGGSYDERDIVDAGFLELVRLGIVRPADPTILNSLAVVDRVLRVETRNGPAWYRYNHDAYGETTRADPYAGSGVGRLWPVLTGERGEYELAAGRPAFARALLVAMQRFAYGAGMIPEQVWDVKDVPAAAGAAPDDESSAAASGSIGLRNGEATGSAGPLNWSMAQYIRLAADLAAGRLLEQPSAVAARYGVHPIPAGPLLRIDAPPVNRHHFTSPLRVQGVAAPGAHVLVVVYTYDGRRHLYPAHPDSAGRFALSVPLGLTTNTMLILASDVHGATSLVSRSIIRRL